ncbi:MAG: hypothetical protein KC543_13545 [Myxococcales bacterium]|nr:hypothetical protein [Myxococcales bacterium]
MRLLVVLLVVIRTIGCGTEPAPPVTPGNAQASIGTNLSEVHPWEENIPFVDAMKTSDEWRSDQGPVDVDAHGWVRSLAPGQSAYTVMFGDFAHGYPDGEYIVRYDGEGTITYDGGARKVDAKSVTGRDVISVDHTRDQIVLTIRATNPSNYIRNISVLMPGGACSNDGARLCHESSDCTTGATCVSFERIYKTQIFYPPFLASLKPYSTIRFMAWMRPNDNWLDPNGPTYPHWSGRVLPDDARYSGARGVPLEVMVALANRLHSNPWFTIDYLANDADVTAFATYVRDHLAPDLKVYIEHSNEVWNPEYPQHQYAVSQAYAEGINTSDEFESALRYHSKRSVEIAEIFEQVFGGTSRLVRVMGSQAYNPWVSQTLLDYGDALQHTDALGIAPYVGSTIEYGDYGRLMGMTLDQLFTEVSTHYFDDAMNAITGSEAVASARGVGLVAYEAGQQLVQWNAPQYALSDPNSLASKFVAMNRDPRMKQLYLNYFNAWKAAGGGLAMHYYAVGSYTRFGSWGALEYLGEPRSSAPKYDALLTFSASNPPWW